MTKTYKFKKNIVGLLSLLCSVGPLITFFIMGLVEGEDKEKIVLTMTMIGAIILSLFALLRKIHLRSVTYIIMIGLWVALDRLLPFILTIAICTILDELLFTPLYKRWNEDYHTHKQIDKRLGTKT